MANVKYQIKEFTPQNGQKGSHSFYAERVINNIIDNVESTPDTRGTTAEHAKDSSVAIRTVAKAEDVTPDRLTWNVAAIVGINFSKTFAQQKSAKKVATVSDESSSTSGTQSGGNTTPPEIEM